MPANCNILLHVVMRAARADTNLVNLSAAARELKVNYVTLWRWIKKGNVTPIRVLGMPFLSPDQIDVLKREKGKRATAANP